MKRRDGTKCCVNHMHMHWLIQRYAAHSIVFAYVSTSNECRTTHRMQIISCDPEMRTHCNDQSEYELERASTNNSEKNIHKMKT